MSGHDGRFEIRKATATDEPLIAKAWQQAYGDMARFKYPGRWQWGITRGNPYVAEERQPPVWIATDGRQVAAWTCALVVPLHAGGKQILGACMADTFTLERFRRRGLGQKLQDENRRAHAVCLSIDPSPANRRNKHRLGGWPGRPLTTYLKLLGSLDGKPLFDSALDVVAKYLGARTARASAQVGGWVGRPVLSTFFTAGFRVRRQLLKSRAGAVERRALTFREVDEFGRESDQLWDEVAPEYSFAVRRDATYLNWKYVRQPHQSYRKFLAYADGRLVGTLIYRHPVSPPEQRAGIVSECFCADPSPSIYAAMYAHAEADLASRGLRFILCGSSTLAHGRALEALGYQEVDIDVPVVHVSPGADGLDREVLVEGDWLLSLGDQDLDQIRRVHQPSFVESVRLLAGRTPGSENLP
jgi:hypothetical protein